MENYVTLPDELKMWILAFLPHQDICRCSLVCKHWHFMTNQDYIWKKCWENTLHEPAPEDPQKPVKQLFIERVCFRQWKLEDGNWVVQRNAHSILVALTGAGSDLSIYFKFNLVDKATGNFAIRTMQDTWRIVVDGQRWFCELAPKIDLLTPVASAHDFPTLDQETVFGDCKITPVKIVPGYGPGIIITHPEWKGCEVHVVAGSNGWITTKRANAAQSVTLLSNTSIAEHLNTMFA